MHFNSRKDEDGKYSIHEIEIPGENRSFLIKGRLQGGWVPPLITPSNPSPVKSDVKIKLIHLKQISSSISNCHRIRHRIGVFNLPRWLHPAQMLHLVH